MNVQLRNILTANPSLGYFQSPKADLKVFTPSTGAAHSTRNVYQQYYDPRWETTFMLSTKSFQGNGKLRDEVMGTLVCLPGAGCKHSTVNAMIATGEMFRKIKTPEGDMLFDPKTKRRQTLAVLSFNHPGQENSPDPEQFTSLTAYLTWVQSIVAWAKSWGKPVVALGRSTGANVLLEYNHLYSAEEGMLSGAMFMSGYSPSWSSYAINYILGQDNFEISYPSMWWSMAFDGASPLRRDFNTPHALAEASQSPKYTSQWTWPGEAGVTYGHHGTKVPGLILYGGNDKEYPETAEDYWKSYAERMKYELFVNPNAGHDHFQRMRTPEFAIKQSAEAARRFILKSLRETT